MTDQQIRLQFGEMNAAEMRLARAIVGWYEAEQAQLIQDWADTDTAVREICRKAGLDVDGTPAHVPDIPELVEGLAKENAKLRAGLAEAFKIIDVLYMDALDNHKESWPRAREWMELWNEVEE
jgi:hypothetical protein